MMPSIELSIDDCSEDDRNAERTADAGVRQLGRGRLQERNARCAVAEAGGPEGALEAFLEGELPLTSFTTRELRGWESEWVED